MRGVVPGFAVVRLRLCARDAFACHQALERGEPVQVVGLSCIRIAGELCSPDLFGQRRCPFTPGVEAPLVQEQYQSKSLRLPRFAEHWAFVVTG